MLFHGVFHHAIDAKGRTSLPAHFRDQLAAEGEDRLFVTRDLIDPCLFAFEPKRWKEMMEKIAARSIFDQNARLLSRRFFAPAQECSVDKLGRILIPPTLRESIGLGEQITWAGNGQRIEIWKPEGWAAVERSSEEPVAKEQLMKDLSTIV